MLIVMKPTAQASDIEKVLEVIERLGFRGHTLPGENRTAIGVTGNRGSIDPAHFENLPGVADAIRVTKPYKLISKDARPEKSIVKVGNASIGGKELAMIAGPCAIESREQLAEQYPQDMYFHNTCHRRRTQTCISRTRDDRQPHPLYSQRSYPHSSYRREL